MKKKAGFTLLELIVVIGIVGLLTTFATAAVNDTRVKTRDAQRLTTLENVLDSLEIYYDINNIYPTGFGGGSAILGIESPEWASFAGICIDGSEPEGFRHEEDCDGVDIIYIIPYDPSLPYVDPGAPWANICVHNQGRTEPCYSVYLSYDGGSRYDLSFFQETETEYGPRGTYKVNQDGIITTIPPP